MGRSPELLGRFPRQTACSQAARRRDPTPDGQTDVGSLGLRVRLEPGRSATLPFDLGLALSEPGQLLERRGGGDGQDASAITTPSRFADAWAPLPRSGPTTSRTGGATPRSSTTRSSRARCRRRCSTPSPARCRIIRTTTCLRTADGELPRLRGLQRQRRLLPDGLHPRLELRAGAGATSSRRWSARCARPTSA